MHAKHIILFLLIAWALSGCTWLRESWPWRKKDVPITRPTMVAPAPDDAAGETRPATASPRPEGEPAPPLAPAPEVTKPEAQAVTPPEEQIEPSLFHHRAAELV